MVDAFQPEELLRLAESLVGTIYLVELLWCIRAVLGCQYCWSAERTGSVVNDDE